MGGGKVIVRDYVGLPAVYWNQPQSLHKVFSEVVDRGRGAAREPLSCHPEASHPEPVASAGRGDLAGRHRWWTFTFPG